MWSKRREREPQQQSSADHLLSISLFLFLSCCSLQPSRGERERARKQQQNTAKGKRKQDKEGGGAEQPPRWLSAPSVTPQSQRHPQQITNDKFGNKAEHRRLITRRFANGRAMRHRVGAVVGVAVGAGTRR